MLTGLNIALLAALIFMHINSQNQKAVLDDVIRIRSQYNYDDLLPSIIYSKDDKVDVIFRQVHDEKDKKLSNCVNPNVQGLRNRSEALQSCLPLFKEYRPPSKKINKQLMKDVPNFVPRFGEAGATVDLPYNEVKWKKLYNEKMSKENILHRLGFYKNRVPEDKYDYDPQVGKAFDIPHMGIFNMNDYCHVHDQLILNNPDLALKKKYFITDYHQMSLPRMFVMNKMGKDLMPKVSKNMPKINFYQKLYPLDFRANMFFFKKATFHNYHEIGKHFGCYGQSYNHIPGHGGIVRKDLLTKHSVEWFNKLKDNKKCERQLNYFPSGYRLYVRNDCKQFFKLINSKAYENDKKRTPIQFIMKAGYGVHRGVGVELLDLQLEKKLREQYSNGTKCGEISQNLIAQKYISDPVLFKGHKFDFRMYMMVSSVNPLKIYYHDGFLRISLEKYDKSSRKKNTHITNTELSKKIIKECQKYGRKYHDMTADELRNFQMQSLEQLAEIVEKYLDKGSSVYVEGKLQTRKWQDKNLAKSFKNDLSMFCE